MVRGFALTVAYAVAYAGFFLLGYASRLGPHGASPFWPLSGFSLAVLLLVPTRHWARLVIVSYALSVALKMHEDGTDLGVSLASQTMGSAEALLAAAVLRYRTSFDPALRRTRDFLLLAGVSIFVATPIAAALGAAQLTRVENPSLSFLSVFETWSLGDSLGILLFAPPFLASARGFAWFADRREAVEGALFVVAALLVGLVGLGGVGAMSPTLAAFLASPVLCFAAFRYGLRVTSYLAVFLSTTAVASALVVPPETLTPHLIHTNALASLQVFGFVAVAMVLLAVALDEQRAESEAHLRVERSLRSAQKFEALGRLSSGVAHDFNNVLAAIMASAELVQLTADRARIDALADEILAAATRGADIVKQLMRYGRHDGAERARRCLDVIVARESTILRRLLGPGSRLDLRIVDYGLTVLVDELELSRTLMNLVTNASDASPGSARITLSVARCAVPDEPFGDPRPTTPLPLGFARGTYACVTVEDEGHGMRADVLGRLFEPFFTTKPAGQGTGLGLASAFAFVSGAGGAIVVSSAEGAGTTVRLLLPIDTEPQAAPIRADVPRS